jgi:hypothetical protein
MTLRTVGAIGIEVDGDEVPVNKFGVTFKSGVKVVKTMNKSRRPLGHSRGMPEYDLTLTVPIPLDRKEPDWDNAFDCTITEYPLDNIGARTVYTGCAVTEYSEQYTVEGDGAMRDIKVSALGKEIL